MNDNLPPSLRRYGVELERAIRLELDPHHRRFSRRARELLLARPRVLAGITISAAALAIALMMAIGATTSQPAFAITRNPDGTVTVKLDKLSSIPAANRKLAELGINARIAVGRGCQPSPGQRSPQGPPGEVPAPRTQVIRFRPGRRVRLLCYRVAVTVAARRQAAGGVK